MGRRWGQVLAATAVAMAAGAGTAQAATLIVDDTEWKGPGSTWCMYSEINEGSDFGQLADAVAAAQPGDTISVCPGVYTGNIQTSTPGLRIVGPPNGLTSSQRAGGPTQWEAVVRGQSGILLAGPGSSISGMWFEQEAGAVGGQGVMAYADGTEVSRNVVRGFGLGIEVESRAAAIGNWVGGTAQSMAGIAVSGDDARVLENTVRDNGGYGIVVNGNADRTGLFDNTALGNGFATQSVSGAVDPADCRDFSTGEGGTAGTASRWERNTGRTSKPGGLCLPPCRSLTIAPSRLQPVLNPLISPLRPTPVCR